MSTIFSEQEWLRYTRHVQLPGFGAAGQLKLKKSRVLIVGLGGLGAPVAMYLAAAGVGNLTLMDSDNVDLTNLQRQVIYKVNDIGKPKVQASAAHLSSLNPEITITSIHEHFSPSSRFTHDFDLVIDCSDNFSARYAVNDYCLRKRTPWIYASVHQHSGQCSVFIPDQACFRCLFPKAPDTFEDCNTAGVLGVLPGMLGLFQANEAITFLASGTSELANTLMLFNARELTLQKITLAKDPSCVCAAISSTGDATDSNIDLSPTPPAAQCATTHSALEISVEDFLRHQQNHSARIIDVRSSEEREAFHIGGEHITLATLLEHPEELDKSQPVIFYCQSGARSLKAAAALSALGHTCFNLQGGILNWLREKPKIMS